MKPIKVCSCSKIYYEIPKGALLWTDDDSPFKGWYWNCVCGSTLFVRNKDVPRADTGNRDKD